MIRELFQGGKWQFPFVIYHPEVMDENLPLIVFLHGAGERGMGGEELPRVESSGFAKVLQEEDCPCIYVAPQCSPDSFWVAEVPNIHDFIVELTKTYPVDEKKIFLTGLSMGGFGTWYTAMRYPDMFAAIAPVCGGGMVWNAGVLQMPIWAFHGTEDDVVYPSETINMIHKLRSLGTNKNEVKMTLLDGVAHNAWDYAYNQELLEWLLSKVRKRNGKESL